MAKARDAEGSRGALEARRDLVRSVRLLARRLIDEAPLRVVADELGWSPEEARLLEGHLVRVLEREGVRVRGLEAWPLATPGRP